MWDSDPLSIWYISLSAFNLGNKWAIADTQFKHLFLVNQDIREEVVEHLAQNALSVLLHGREILNLIYPLHNPPLKQILFWGFLPHSNLPS